MLCPEPTFLAILGLIPNITGLGWVRNSVTEILKNYTQAEMRPATDMDENFIKAI